MRNHALCLPIRQILAAFILRRNINPQGKLRRNGIGPTSRLRLAMSSVYALVVAAGQGTRLGGPRPKQYLPLGSATILRHAVAALGEHRRIANVLVAIRPEDRRLFTRSVAGLAVIPPVAGGARSQGLVR